MGMDIHLGIIREDEVIAKEIFDGRNSEWFRNLMGKGWDNEYDYFPSCGTYPITAPQDYVDKYADRGTYFGHGCIQVKDFKDWFNQYRPDLKAGWVSTYDKWRIERKNYIPEDLPITLDKDDNINDMHFIEYVNTWDCSRWLLNYLNDHNIPDDAYICYCFDH